MSINFFDAIDQGEAAAMRVLSSGVTVDLEATDEEYGETGLMVAARKGMSTLVGGLLAAGANIEATNSSGSTALMHASEHGRIECVNTLLVAGANADAAIESGATALMIASQDCHITVVDTLIAAGANVDAVDREGNSALVYAAANDEEAAVGSLIAAGAIVHSQPNDVVLLEAAAARGAQTFFGCETLQGCFGTPNGCVHCMVTIAE